MNLSALLELSDLAARWDREETGRPDPHDVRLVIALCRAAGGELTINDMDLVDERGAELVVWRDATTGTYHLKVREQQNQAVAEPYTCRCGLWDKPCTTQIPTVETLCAVCRRGCSRLWVEGALREHADFKLTAISGTGR